MFKFLKEKLKGAISRISKKIGEEKPIEEAVKHLPKIWVVDNAVDTVCHGASLSIPGISKLNNFNKNETIAIMTLKDELIALGDSILDSNEVMKKEKGLVVKTTKVFMERNVYPKFTFKE